MERVPDYWKLKRFCFDFWILTLGNRKWFRKVISNLDWLSGLNWAQTNSAESNYDLHNYLKVYFFFPPRLPFFFFRLATMLRQYLRRKKSRVLIIHHFISIIIMNYYFCKIFADRFIMKIIIACSISCLSASSLSCISCACLYVSYLFEYEYES